MLRGVLWQPRAYCGRDRQRLLAERSSCYSYRSEVPFSPSRYSLAPAILDGQAAFSVSVRSTKRGISNWELLMACTRARDSLVDVRGYSFSG